MEVPFFSLSYFNQNSNIAQGKNSSHKVTIEAIDKRGNVVGRINVIVTVKVGNGYPPAVSTPSTGGNSSSGNNGGWGNE